jgi:AcrR family transcriptional regulator
MPKLWTETVKTHRKAVQDAALDAAATLVAQHGLRSVTMAQIAEAVGIGRATLYKYFPDVESMLTTWHERQVNAHLERLIELQAREGSPRERLEAVLETYANIQHDLRQVHATELAAHLHRGEHVVHAQRRLKELLRDLLTQGAKAGELRGDVSADELATYCLHALSAAARLPSKAAVRRLVVVTVTGLLPPQSR